MIADARKRGRVVTAAPSRARSRNKQLRFSDLVEPALEEKRDLKHNEASSIRTDRVRLRRILPVIGDAEINKLTPGHLARLLQSLSRGDATHRGIKGSTMNRFHSLLSTIFRYAVRSGFLDVNPMARGSVPRSKEPPIHVRYLSSEEQRRLLAVIRKDCPHKALELELAILTGMRRGEQFNAEWQKWNAKLGVLNIAGKTGSRAVQISRAAARCLRRLRRRAPRNQVFITPERNYTEQDRRLWFENATKKAGLPAFHYHDLRHTFASRLAIAGVPLLEIQQLLGHKTIGMTLRYAHLSPERRRKAVERVRF